LEQQTTSAERKNESGFHVAGFERREGATIPVCRVVRNVTDHDPQTGLYTTNLGYWEANEHIPRGNLDHVKLGTFRRSLREHQRHQGVPYWLRNGDLPDFSKPQNAIHTAARELINTPRFAAPTQLIHWQRLAEIMVGTAASLCGIYYTAGAPTVEGRAHAVAIPWPDPG
jgi:hypothetical protein